MRTGVATLIGALILTSGPALAASPGAVPIIAHHPISSCEKGQPVSIKARIRSPIGKRIFAPTVFVRLAQVRGLVRVPLQPVAGDDDGFEAVLPASLTQGDFEYYVEAFDDDGNGPARVGGPDASIKVRSEPATVAVADASSTAPRSWKRTAGIAGVGAGAALVAGGLVSGAFALAAKQDMVKAVDGAQYNAALARGQRAATVANVMVAGGVVVAGAGAVLWLLGSKGASDGGKVAFTVGAGPSGAAVMMAGRF